MRKKQNLLYFSQKGSDRPQPPKSKWRINLQFFLPIYENIVLLQFKNTESALEIRLEKYQKKPPTKRLSKIALKTTSSDFTTKIHVLILTFYVDQKVCLPIWVWSIRYWNHVWHICAPTDSKFGLKFSDERSVQVESWNRQIFFKLRLLKLV